jgi:hypothetical protein
VQRNHDVAAAWRRLSEHCPTVGIQELPHGDRWIMGGGDCRSGKQFVDRLDEPRNVDVAASRIEVIAEHGTKNAQANDAPVAAQSHHAVTIELDWQFLDVGNHSAGTKLGAASVFWIPLAGLDLTAGATVKKLALKGGETYSGDASGGLQPGQPFAFLPAKPQ